MPLLPPAALGIVALAPASIGCAVPFSVALVVGDALSPAAALPGCCVELGLLALGLTLPPFLRAAASVAFRSAHTAMTSASDIDFDAAAAASLNPWPLMGTTIRSAGPTPSMGPPGRGLPTGVGGVMKGMGGAPGAAGAPMPACCCVTIDGQSRGNCSRAAVERHCGWPGFLRVQKHLRARGRKMRQVTSKGQDREIT
ncbi:hypothetical protein Vretimale_4435 [Volvox reticuliferus]|uniref:Uncharacterized protein n=1 Tax=Volvox reticuliferus TaxID=1737510 RepID=A0A8J4C1S7_9CHLO|nr:hypothetical protein Vretifemale_3102 [Volvox reticuliferus]GIL99276.1 hypothetical protein Vretimale_4435 [Volvox reticuliferus]